MNFRIGLFGAFIMLKVLFNATTSCAQSEKNSSDYILLSGEVVSPAGTPIAGVHILNTSTNTLSISDENGFFSLTMNKTQVLRFSAVGFRTYYFTIKGKAEDVMYKRITLQTVTVGLKNVDIVAKEEPRAERFFRPKPVPAFTWGYQGEQHEVGPNLGNPVSLLYDWLSKEGKQKRKLEELLKEEAVKKLVAKRFESDLFWELTGLTGKELNEFKEYCNLSDHFVATSSDYDFLLKIKKCFNTFEPTETNNYGN